MSSQQFRDYPEPRRSTLGRKVLLVLVAVLLILLGAVGLARYGQDLPLIGPLFGGGSDLDDPPVVISEIQDLNQLTTTRWIGQVVVTEDAEPGRVQSLAGAIGVDTSALTGESVIITATGEVEAGVNLDEMTEDDFRVNEEAGTVNIDLPEAEIFSSSLDEDRTGVYDRDRGIFVRGVNDALVEDARREAVANIEQSAEESGILDQANSNAEASLRSIVESLGYREVTFE